MTGGVRIEERSGKKARKEVDLEMDIYLNHEIRAYPGWESEPQPWSAATAMTHVSFPHFDRLWPTWCHEKHCKSKDAKYSHIEDLEVKWRFLTILRAISNREQWPKNSIPRSIAALMYAEHVLRMRVDWSTLKGEKFGHLGTALLARRPKDIPYSPVPDWFRANPKLRDEPGRPLPPDREGKQPRWKPSHVSGTNVGEEDMDIALGQAFGAMGVDGDGDEEVGDEPMGVGADGGSTGPFGRVTGADAVATGSDGVATGADKEATGSDTRVTESDTRGTRTAGRGPDAGVTGPDGGMTGADGGVTGADGRVTGADGDATGADSEMTGADGGVGRVTEADVEAYKARILYLEAKLASLGLREDVNSNDGSVVWLEEFDQPPQEVVAEMVVPPSFQPNEADRKGKQPMTVSQLWKYEECVAALGLGDHDLQAERDTAVDCANVVEHFAAELIAQNEELQQRLKILEENELGYINLELQKKLEKLNVDLLEANARLTSYEVMEDNTVELKRENKKLKKCLTELVEEHEALRVTTTFAVARARQYESEFQSLQEEWNRNGRLRILQLTSWPLEDTMYKDEWENLLNENGSIHWNLVEEEDHRWDPTQLTEYPYTEAGLKVWPNPDKMLFDGSRCCLCQNPFGPEGCFQVGTCGAQFHPPCLINCMIGKRRCPHCRSPFHSRLYLQFGLKDYMPSHWVYSPYDFTFPLEDYDGKEVEWSWKYNCTKAKLYLDNKDGEWVRNPNLITYVADELYPNKPPNYKMKLFLYQTLGWHWHEGSWSLRRGINPPYYASSGELARTTAELRMDIDDLPNQGSSTGADEVHWEEIYHRNRLKYAAIDSILHRVAPELKIWLNGGPKPTRKFALSPSSMAYRTRSNVRRIEMRNNSDGTPLPPRVLQYGEGGSNMPIEIEDEDSD